jgi:hypothetical protein
VETVTVRLVRSDRASSDGGAMLDVVTLFVMQERAEDLEWMTTWYCEKSE